MITDPHIISYCKAYSSRPPLGLDEVETGTVSTGKMKMLSGQYLGQYLKMMSMILQPDSVLEIGTFTGYGALCLMEGLAPGGKVMTIESDAGNARIAEQHLSASIASQRVVLKRGDALEVLEGLDEEWDLVFIDAAKRQYIKYYEIVLPQLRRGGVILADNVLWKGKVGRPDNDKLGLGLDAFNQYVFKDERVDNIIIPIDDGVNFIVKL